MRELLRAVLTNKPIIALMEPDPSHGGLTRAQIRDALELASNGPTCLCVQWGLVEKAEGWGYELPSGEQLYNAVFAQEPIEWNRLGRFQDVTMRLIAERLLPANHAPV
eukprot:2504989-Prymnesium_polylepis.1